MDKINFQNGVTKVNADTFNTFQNNVEKSAVVVSPTQPTTNEKVWFKKGKNKFDKSRYIENIGTGESRTINLRLEPNATYTMSSNISKSSNNTADLFFAPGYNASVTTDANGVWNGQTRTVTSDENGYVTVAYRKQSTSQAPSLIDAWYQIEQGSATEHEAYIEPKIYVLNNNGVYEEFINEKSLVKTNKYSTSEQKIGTWINGKTLYRKIINVTCPSTNQNGTYVNSTTKITDNIETAFIEWAFITDGAKQRQPLLYITNAGHIVKAFVDGAKQFYVANSVLDYNNKGITASILYTKTTD